jgi:dihydroorotate dehydrogenase (NAD+) catalytic subunit
MRAKADLNVRIGKLNLKNPVMVASGTFGCGEEYGKFFDVDELGAVVAKTITLLARAGNPPPRVAETASGMLNSIGLENDGLDDFLESKLPVLKRLRTKVIASIAGDDEREFSTLAKRLEGAGHIDALELNLSCPNIRHGRRLKRMIAQDAGAVRRVVRATRRSTRLTLIAKLSPNVTDIAPIAKAAEAEGADAVCLVNTFPSMAIDIKRRAPVLGNITGGLSGPAIKPIALKMVWDVYCAVDIPVIGIGGIMTAEDAMEFILCGATAVQAGTANFVNPRAPLDILRGIERYLVTTRVKSVKELIGKVRV